MSDPKQITSDEILELAHLRAEVERLRGLLREAQNYVIDASDGSTPYAKAAESCWQRIDAAIAARAADSAGEKT